MQSSALLLFVIFALVLAGMYLSIRRGWFAPGMTAAVGVILSMIVMVMISLAQNNLPIQAIVVGILVGGVFSGVTLAAAWYFHSQELRARYADGDGYSQEE
jgi:prepilin signal peptidase PulO-like enzyme (type II secretory pathway)